jgi:hypothetical protein
VTHVILQPAGDPHARQHYADTIESPVSMQRLARFLMSDDIATLRAAHGERAVPTWGVTPGGREVNRHKWQRISPGDIALMARDRQIFVSGVVTHKAHSQSLAEELWGTNDSGATWEYLYFLDDIRPQAISVPDLNAVVGFEPGARVQGFNVLSEAKSEEILTAFGLARSGLAATHWEVTDWTLRPGDRIERKALHDRYGGRRQGGIGPSRRSPNVLLFTDPVTGRRHGYFDEWTLDGMYNYYGEGQRGDQRIVSGNAAVANHENDGRALRLFEGSGAMVTYIGEFALDTVKPWFEADAPETDGGSIRKAIVFRLRPVDIPPEPGSAVPATVRALMVEVVPVEEQFTEHAYVDPAREPYEAERREAILVRALRDHLVAMGHQVGRFRILPPGESKPLFSDLFDETSDVLVEGKGSVSRESIRMAIGQLADYVRFCPGAARVILVPECPRADLVALCRAQGIALVWPIGGSYAAQPALPW